MRRFTPIEIAIAIAVTGAVCAVAIPAFVSNVHGSRFVEPTDGLDRIGKSALAFAEANGHFPDSAPLTPPVPPRGKKEADPPGTWDTPAWKALDFRPAPEGVPHAYAFSYESNGTSFTAQARGDLDGDGVTSLFEIKGILKPGEKPALVPGMHVEAELE